MTAVSSDEGTGAAKLSAQSCSRRGEQRFNTEKIPASRSVLNESGLEEVIPSRAVGALLKEAESQQEQLTAQFKTASSKDAIQSDRDLQANTFSRQFARAHRSQEKRVLLFFGSEAENLVDASSFEPVGCFTTSPVCRPSRRWRTRPTGTRPR